MTTPIEVSAEFAWMHLFGGERVDHAARTMTRRKGLANWSSHPIVSAVLTSSTTLPSRMNTNLVTLHISPDVYFGARIVKYYLWRVSQ